MKKRKYSLWVGGVEVNDFYLTEQEALNLLEEYKDYKDAKIRKELK